MGKRQTETDRQINTQLERKPAATTSWAVCVCVCVCGYTHLHTHMHACMWNTGWNEI